MFQESPIRTEKTLSLVALIRDGGLGGQIIIGLLFFLLLIAIYIYFERWFAIRAASKIDKNFYGANQALCRSRKKSKAAQALLSQRRSSGSAFNRERNFKDRGRPLEDINTTIENAGRLEVYKLEKECECFLATIAGAAPMIGFFRGQ